jgi:radical SAM superfamily enzyme YgiQ (UPF0313 family)
VFVNPRCDIYPPIGLCSLSAYLKEHLPGIETVLVDIPPATPLSGAAALISAAGPDLIAITTYTIAFSEVTELCRCLKQKNPVVPIVLGGPHITSLPGTLPVQADIGVIGEGEATLLELCRSLATEHGAAPDSLAPIRGICYHGPDGFVVTAERGSLNPLDSIPFPDLSILNMRWYTARRMYFTMKGNFRGFVLLTSRGCPFSCRFCQASAQWGRCRYHSAERVVAELERIRREYPQVDAVNIIDDLFIGDRRRLREMVRLIRLKGLHHGLVFNVNGHAKLIDAEVIGLLKSINVIQIAYGFESGSERVLDFLKKGSATVELNSRAAALTNGAGIGVGGQFMIGSPGETEADIRQTLEFIKRTPMSHVHVSATTPMPGTELWDICRAKGLVSEAMDWRTLDFGNPDTTALLYCNEEFIPYQRFNELKTEVKRVADRWNPVPSLLANLSYWQLYTPREFFRRVLMGLNRMRHQYVNKFRHKVR